MDMDMDMDMFPRSRLGRMHHDPFANFGNSNFAFPQFNSLGRRRPAADHMGHEDDFFNRLPSEFRQYIPEGFRHRRAGSGSNMHDNLQQHGLRNTVDMGVKSATPSESQSQEAIPLPPPGGMQSPGVLAIAPAPVLALAPAPAPKENQPAIQTGDEQATTTAAETTTEAASTNNNGETK